MIVYPPRAWRFAAVLSGVALVLVAGLLWAGLGTGPSVWVLGALTITYEIALLCRITAVAAWAVPRRTCPRGAQAAGPDTEAALPLSLAVIIAARNEATGLPRTLLALAEAQAPAEMIIVVDDGSTDGTWDAVNAIWPLQALGSESWTAPGWPALQVWRQPASGKAAALNRALHVCTTDAVITLDADTRVEPAALVAFRAAFSQQPALVAACGVLEPDVGARPGFWGGFQRLEYLRSFVWRLGWASRSSLVLISGAFACFRREALMAVGGFDTTSLVEDYEVMYRLQDDAIRSGMGPIMTAVVGEAGALTEVPLALRPFVRQRRRWFAGFVRTLCRYRHLVGWRQAGAFGRRHLVIKTVDVLLPALGLSAWLALAILICRGSAVSISAWWVLLGIITARAVVEVILGTWCWTIYRRWRGRTPMPYLFTLPLLILEGLCFQPLRQLCAVLGCLDCLGGRRRW